ncbi:acyltransferase family protein [Bacteroidota bacterium]
MKTVSTNRLYYIDWLRVLAFGLLFVFHSFRFFDDFPWHLKNDHHHNIFNSIVLFTHTWRMPLIFIISGIGTYFALSSRAKNFVIDRVKRLVIPYFFGIIILIPPQKFLESVSQYGFQGNFIEFIIAYPTYIMESSTGLNLVFTGHFGYHIWYLAFLFIQTLIFLPVFYIINRNKQKIARIISICERPPGMLLVGLVIIILDIVLRPSSPDYLGWADFAVYSVYFVLGFLFQAHGNIKLILKQNTWFFLCLAVISSISIQYILTTNENTVQILLKPSYTVDYVLIGALMRINGFAWVLAVLGLGARFLDFKYRLLNDFNQGILPFYILHQTVIIMIGYNIIQWDNSIFAKLLLILSLSFMTTILAYQGIIKLNVLRFLFGMKKKQSTNSIK